MKQLTKELIWSYAFALWVFAFVSFLFVWIFLYPFVFKPAYYSVVASCNPKGHEIISSKGYQVAGTYNPQTNKIKADYTKPNDSRIFIPNFKTVRHELCHAKQDIDRRVYNCEYPFVFNYISEVECYWIENLPIYEEEINDFIENYENQQKRERLPLEK